MAIEPFEDAEACGKRGHFNGRCIITKGMNRYANLAQFVNRGDCLALKSDQLDDQVSLKAYCRCIDAVNQGNWSLSIKLRLECFVIIE